MSANPNENDDANFGDDAASFIADSDALGELCDLDPARAELWVSGLLADYGTTEILEALAAHLPLDPGGAHALLAAVIAEVAEPEPAREAELLGADQTVTTTPWARYVGSAKPVDAMRVFASGEHTTTIVRFAHADDAMHLVLVDLNSATAPFAAADIRFAPDGLFDAEVDDPELELRPATLAEVAAEFVGAIESPLGDEPGVELNVLVARRRALALREAVGDTTALVPLALRVDVAGAPLGDDHESDQDERDLGADSAAVEALEAALKLWFGSDGADSLAPTADDFATGAARIRDHLGGPAAGDLAVVLAAAGLTGDEADEPLVLGCCGAYVLPRSLVAFEPTEIEAIRHLEWADWFGAVAVLVRKGPGVTVTPTEMVKAINRCPEVTTTIPKADADYVGWSFERTLHAWELTGVLADDATLTGFGQRVLPHALRHRWQGN